MVEDRFVYQLVSVALLDEGTVGRIPRGPHTGIGPLTVVSGCLSRSVRDTARWYDVCAGFDPRDPYSLPKEVGWEAQLGQPIFLVLGLLCHRIWGQRLSVTQCESSLKRWQPKSLQ